MEEEGCSKCFGCAFATTEAAVLNHQATLLTEFVFETNAHPVGAPYIEIAENNLAKHRAALHRYADDCAGYSEKKRASGRPAKMCDSPEVKFSKEEILAGKILEQINPTAWNFK